MNGFERRKEINREKIRRAAEELFNKYGIDRVSISDIAAKAPVSQVTIYNLFGSKDKLILDLITDMGNKSIEHLHEISNSDKPYFERVEDIVQAMVGMNEANPGLADFNMENNADIKQLGEYFTGRIKGLFLDFIHKGQKEGYCNPELSDDAIDAYIEIIIGGMNANPEIHARTHHDPRLFHDLILIMLFGVGHTPTRN